MSFIRPDAAAQINRWREALTGLALVVPGLWWSLTGSGLMPYIGAVLLIIGGVLIAVGVQRARFRIPGRGPGLVRMTEDQIAYFGPLSGGIVALPDLTELSIDTSGAPAQWILSQPLEPDLVIPVTADGAEALFDAFARLPGLKTEHMLARMQSTAPKPVTIWVKPNPERAQLQ